MLNRFQFTSLQPLYLNHFHRLILSKDSYKVLKQYNFISPHPSISFHPINHYLGKSSRSQRGLFHQKSHHGGSRITFSHKKTKHTFKPNIGKKKVYSEVLDKSIKMWVSTHAMKCIQHKGGLDEYLLETQPKKIGSKFGMFLRDIIKSKMQDPNYQVPRIPFQCPQPKRKSSYYTRIRHTQGAIYRPAHLKTRPDLVPWDRVHTELRLKEKEKFLQQVRENIATIGPPQDPIGEGIERGQYLTQNGNPIEQEIDFEKGILPKIQKAKFDQKNMTDKDREQVERLKPLFEQIMPFRHRAIRDSLLKVINHRYKLMNLIKIIQDSEVLAEKILQEKYVHYFQRYPDLLQAVQKHYEQNIQWYQKIEKTQGNNVIIQRPKDEKKDQERQLLLEGKEEQLEQDIDGVELKTQIDFNPNFQKKGKKQRIKVIKSKYYRK